MRAEIVIVMDGSETVCVVKMTVQIAEVKDNASDHQRNRDRDTSSKRTSQTPGGMVIYRAPGDLLEVGTTNAPTSTTDPVSTETSISAGIGRSILSG